MLTNHGIPSGCRYGGYAEEVLANPLAMTSIEVRKAEPGLFSVFAQLLGGAIACIGDFPNPAEADSYADEIGTFYMLPVQHCPLALAA